MSIVDPFTGPKQIRVASGEIFESCRAIRIVGASHFFYRRVSGEV